MTAFRPRTRYKAANPEGPTPAGPAFLGPTRLKASDLFPFPGPRGGAECLDKRDSSTVPEKEWERGPERILKQALPRFTLIFTIYPVRRRMEEGTSRAKRRLSNPSAAYRRATDKISQEASIRLLRQYVGRIRHPQGRDLPGVGGGLRGDGQAVPRVLSRVVIVSDAVQR